MYIILCTQCLKKNNIILGMKRKKTIAEKCNNTLHMEIALLKISTEFPQNVLCGGKGGGRREITLNI